MIFNKAEPPKPGSTRHGGWNYSTKEFVKAESCFSCKKEFNFLRRRHHCRYCKNSFCGDCTPNTSAIPEQNQKKAVRVCNTCQDIINGTRTSLLPDKASDEDSFDYDLFVIGGGSGGLACAKAAAKFGKKVAVCDFVTPSETYPHSVWGVGGTCVNVGCIPKKLMHNAGLLKEAINDARHYGWNDATTGEHNWKNLVDGVQKHIQGLNEGIEEDLPEKKIDYFNLFAKFNNRANNHEIHLTDFNGKEETKTARRIVIAVGGRPKIPKCPGAKECCITSDDIFSLQENPGKKVLVIGASYVALECAGFLTSLGHEVIVMVRSILLRGFDQEVAEKIGMYMAKQGTRFIHGKVPTKMVRVFFDGERKESKIEVCSKDKGKDDDPDAKEETEYFDTVLAAIGRVPSTSKIGLCCAGVMRTIKEKIPVFQEQTNVPHIYAIGDVADVPGFGTFELTPVAIQAGQLLAARLFGNSKVQMDYSNVATTIFTPLEYGCIGLTEEDARKKLGDDNVECYHTIFQPLEMTLPDRMKNPQEDHCFTKLVIDIQDNGRIIGFHYLGPNAGEVTQGFALAMRLKATKNDFDLTVGIHPTNAEKLTTMKISKGSGLSAEEIDC